MQNLLSEFDDQGVIIGGVAVSLLGRPRYTVDLGAVILLNLSDISRLLQSASNLGFEPRIEDAEALEEPELWERIASLL